MPLFLDQLARLVHIAVLLSAPVIVAMFLAEVGLALISRFVPQLDVFFLAMPIKSGLAVLVLLVYLATLFDYGYDYIREQRNVVPFLQDQWGIWR
jgi:type III secretion protein T